MKPWYDSRVVIGNSFDAVRATVGLMAASIRRSSKDVRIRQHAARLAARARPKDYLGQLAEIWKDFVKNWRYVRDPLRYEMIENSPRAVYQYILGGNGGLGDGRGGSDCDGATIGVCSLCDAIGFPCRIVTMAVSGLQPGRSMSHVYAQVFINGVWITVDPVLYPNGTLGDEAPASRRAYWNLSGRMIGNVGNFR
mgnify:CR=1 FL=1